MIQGLKIFNVEPILPERLKPLKELAYNMWWCWNHDATELFRRIDRRLWEETKHNPVKMLKVVPQERFEELLHIESFLEHMDSVKQKLDDYLNGESWFSTNYKDETKDPIRFAYFSAEFGIHESLPIYSGGLGILAGDHLKSASDLGIPLVGVGLLYSQGYFTQYLNEEGWQQEKYPLNDFSSMPVQEVLDENGQPVYTSVEILNEEVKVKIWKVNVGRVTLYLLDTNIPENSPAAREITYQLYGGDLHMRIKQEILLGIGGVRALRTLGLNPHVYHMNEGHSAFLVLERIKNYIEEKGVDFHVAKEAVIAESVFTTHTPVPAGNDRFPPGMIYQYFSEYVKKLGITVEELLSYGRENVFDNNESFCMTVLALKLSSHANGVSKLHGHVSRNMWKNVWPGVPVNEIPIDHITNGIHIPTWVSDEMTIILDRYLGKRWRDESYDLNLWERVNSIPNTELWRTHERLRERLVAFTRMRLKQQLARRGASKVEIERAESVLSSDVLTIGFARRFATYKRAILLFTDIERLKRIILNKERPVQFIFAGKAHPRDNEGKEFIRRIIQIAKMPEFRNNIVFIEDYDMNVARHLVQGVDVWLNNPRRPLEASGTSGMKVVPNGGLNFSVLDGWWPEAYNTENGWAIGSGEEYDDPALQDRIEANILYELLENDIIPKFYNRGPDGLPLEWINMMKNSMRTISPQFNTNRMVSEYVEKFYLPAEANSLKVRESNLKVALEIKNFKEKLIKNWDKIEIVSCNTNISKELVVGDDLIVEAVIRIGGLLTPEDITVQAYYSELDVNDEMIAPETKELEVEKKLEDNLYQYKGIIKLQRAGKFGLRLRILPKQGICTEKFIPGLIKWNVN